MLGLAATAAGAPITPEEALRRATAGGPHKAAARMASRSHQPILVHTVNTGIGEPAAYVFNSASDEAGYMVLSADDCAYPVLGYSDSGTIDSGAIPPQMQWWLEQYGKQIEYARQHPETKGKSTGMASQAAAAREAIAPLVTTRWDQGAPFNDACPLYGTTRTYTGCVATAMAQVMNYWKYPERGKGSISYTSATIEKKLTLNLSQRAFDWENMKDTYYDGYTAQQATAVAYLMKAAGYSVKMDYTTDASGALAMDISNALVKYFDYDPNMLYTIRDYYSSDQWDEMIYKNLKEVGPILYGGGTYVGGGHSFVCDGYDGEGFYHFNWGWSGMSNGYFALSALTPDALGTGGGAGGGYTFSQDAIFGIQPPTGKEVETRPLELTQMGSLTGKIALNMLTLDLTHTGEAMWVNYNAKTQKVGFGAIIEPQGNTVGETRYVVFGTQRYELPGGYGTGPQYVKPEIALSDLNLANGTYKVTMSTFPVATADAEVPEGKEWTPVRPAYGYFNYVTLIKDGTKYTVKTGELPKLKITGELVGKLYYGGCSKWRVTVENLSDVEATSGFAPCLSDEEMGPVLLGESVFLVIPPHSKVVREWDTMLYSIQQKVYNEDTKVGFTFFNEYDYIFYDDLFLSEVTIHPSPGTPSIAMDNPPQVANSKSDVTEGFIRYIISDPLNIEISARPRLLKGVFQNNMMICLCSPAEDGGVNIETYGGQPMYMSIPGGYGKFSTTLSYPLMKPGVNYYLIFAYETGQGLATFDNVGATMIMWPGDSSGIEDVTTGEAALPVEVYNLQGVKVGDSTEGLSAGIYIIRQGDKVTKVKI